MQGMLAVGVHVHLNAGHNTYFAANSYTLVNLVRLESTFEKPSTICCQGASLHEITKGPSYEAFRA